MSGCGAERRQSGDFFSQPGHVLSSACGDRRPLSNFSENRGVGAGGMGAAIGGIPFILCLQGTTSIQRRKGGDDRRRHHSDRVWGLDGRWGVFARAKTHRGGRVLAAAGEPAAAGEATAEGAAWKASDSQMARAGIPRRQGGRRGSPGAQHDASTGAAAGVGPAAAPAAKTGPRSAAGRHGCRAAAWPNCEWTAATVRLARVACLKGATKSAAAYAAVRERSEAPIWAATVAWPRRVDGPKVSARMLASASSAVGCCRSCRRGSVRRDRPSITVRASLRSAVRPSYELPSCVAWFAAE